MYYCNNFDYSIINFTYMNKEDITRIKNDIKSFKRVHRVVCELINNFPEDAQTLCHLEEFLQLSNARIFLEKAIIRLENLLDKIEE